ncbi:inorganic anion transporter, sulfate permease (SulP) subfamily protein [Acanthamoeba castellanii str. Neff]|uniref:Inorganic anion transporter, sulfate permease (SulP) subfamily protein n=1 Tax=Acanthamoeba castellanii (strain ATCC 30010 / Neff) TaxID=1257118 RepID=L8H8G3_ACACF|nr:inorganic anion transporter, sulfate permease (SulP) subfamily protein [Acanthamoeba castellanii str. Neff]ELR21794.1 inorganic anion transporter, sulfate permease (SulP) subfamily protein [Acanthamoeba castellanii str. Neff]
MEREDSFLEEAISSLGPRLQREVNELQELLRLADTDMTADEEELFEHNFNTYKRFIKDGTHYTLEGVSDTVEIQLKIEKAKADLVCMCYEFVRSYYIKVERTKVLRLLDGFKRLQGRLSTRHELGRREHLRESKRESTAAAGKSESEAEETEDQPKKKKKKKQKNEDDSGKAISPRLTDGFKMRRNAKNGGAWSHYLPINDEPALVVADASPTKQNTTPTVDVDQYPLLRAQRTATSGDAITISGGGSGGTGDDDEAGALTPTTRENTFYDSEYFRAVSSKQSKGRAARVYTKARAQCTRANAFEAVARKLPILRWFPLYYLPWTLQQQQQKRQQGDEEEAEERGLWYVLENLRSDLLAAITVGFMLIPQGMSYALVAELPPIYGLYSALIPLALYCKGTPEYVQAALLVSAISGVLMICGSLLHVGFILENILSHPVLSGFTSGAAIIIMGSQLKHLFRISMSGNTLIEYIESFANSASDIHGWTTAFVKVVSADPFAVPASLLLLILTTLLNWIFDLSTKLGLKEVGALPDGLPEPSWVHALSWDNIKTAFPAAATVSLLGFIESISVAKQFAAKRQYHISVGQELLALGVCNLGGAFFQAFPVTGSLSRSAVNFQAGSRSPLSSLFTAGLISLTLLFLTPAFRYTPLFVLASIVVSAAVLLIDYEEVIFLFKIGDRVDLAQMLIVFLGTLLLGPELGVMVAIAVSLIQLIFKSAKPNFARLGRLPGTLVYKDIKRFPSALRHKGILIVRFDSNLFFANVNWFRETLTKYELKSKHTIYAIILDATGVNTLDSTSIHLLEDLVQEYKTKQIRFLWANVKGSVRDTMNASGLAKKLGVDNFFLTTHDAVDYMLAELEDHGLIKPHLPSTSTSPSPLSEDEPTTDSAASDTDSDEAQKKTPKSGVLARYAVDVDADGEGAADLERGATRARRW